MYEKRIDGRDWDELRPIEAKIHVIKNADGSAYFRMGKTAAFAAVYGPRKLFPKFLQDSEKGLLRVTYWMMPFSGIGGRVKPVPNRRAQELSKVIENALNRVVILDEFPNSVVDVFIALFETDAGSRCVALNAASLALASAGLSMRDLVCAVAMGRVEDKLVVDLNYEEESYDGIVADIPFAVIPSNKEIVLLQGDGHITKDMLFTLLDKKLESAISKIYEVQKKALLSYYEGVEE
ncbi:MAG: exosome complex exonuclease Rrp41 [Candidatus Woesearchaeota archaeon]